jgi:hypothetical protein
MVFLLVVGFFIILTALAFGVVRLAIYLESKIEWPYELITLILTVLVSATAIQIAYSLTN